MNEKYETKLDDKKTYSQLEEKKKQKKNVELLMSDHSTK